MELIDYVQQGTFALDTHKDEFRINLHWSNSFMPISEAQYNKLKEVESDSVFHDRCRAVWLTSKEQSRAKFHRRNKPFNHTPKKKYAR